MNSNSNESVSGKADKVSEGRIPTHQNLGYFLAIVQKISNARSTEEIMAVVRQAAREIAKSDGATFVLRDGNDCFYADEDAIAPLWKGSRFPLADCISGLAMTTAQTIAIPDVYADPRIPLSVYRPTFVKSLLMVPIRTSFPVGAIGNYWATVHDPSPEVIETLEALASIVSVAMENVGLLMNLERKIEELEGANRAKDEFLMTLSHELRTPLHTIQGWSEQLRAQAHEIPLDVAEFTEGLATIARSARQQGKIIDDLLDTTRILSGKMHIDRKSLDLHELLLATLSAFQPSAEARGIRMEFRPSVTSVRVLGDENRLQQVIGNVVSNAIKFSSFNGVIEIKLAIEGEYAFIVIQDFGRGMTKEFLPRAFERFLQEDGTTTRAHGGLGIGLSIARGLAEAHGGTIRAQSRGLNQGTTMSISLPVLPKDLVFGSPSSGTPPIAPTELRGIRLLAIDDDEDARDLLSFFLKKQGAEVQTAGSVTAGLQVAQDFQPDLVICDLSMPEEDGYSFIRKLRGLESGKLRTIPAIAFSAFTDRTYEAQALSAGFDSFIPKPLDRVRFLNDVLKVWRSSQYLTP